METVLCSERHVTEPTSYCGIFIVSWRDILASRKQKVNLIYFNMCLSICFSSLILPALQPALSRSIPVIHFHSSHQSGSVLPPETFGILYEGRSDEFNFMSYLHSSVKYRTSHYWTWYSKTCRQGLTLLTLWNILKSVWLFLTQSHRDALRRTSKKTEEMKREEAKARV